MYYGLTGAIWGSTWSAIKFQLGAVDPAVSITYRFAIAPALLLGYCALRRLPLGFSLRDHGFIALQGILLFALNYWLFYRAELFLPSGLVAVVFSTMVVLNVLNGAWLLARRSSPGWSREPALTRGGSGPEGGGDCAAAGAG